MLCGVNILSPFFSLCKPSLDLANSVFWDQELHWEFPWPCLHSQPRRDSSLVIVTDLIFSSFWYSDSSFFILFSTHTLYTEFVAVLCSPELFLDTSHKEQGRRGLSEDITSCPQIPKMRYTAESNKLNMLKAAFIIYFLSQWITDCIMNSRRLLRPILLLPSGAAIPLLSPT